jgi:hypothetical protein
MARLGKLYRVPVGELLPTRSRWPIFEQCNLTSRIPAGGALVDRMLTNSLVERSCCPPGLRWRSNCSRRVPLDAAGSNHVTCK